MDMRSESNSASVFPARRITVAHVVLSLDVGGLERMVLALIRRTDRSRFRTVLCCLERAGEWFQEAEGFCDAAAVFGKRPGLALDLPLRLARFFAKHRADVVHCHNFAAFFYGSLGAKMAGNRAVVYTVHGPEVPRKRRQRLFQRLPLADAFVTVSEAMSRSAVEDVGVKADRVATIPNGVAVRDGKKVLGGTIGRTGDQEFVVGSVGRLSREKDHETLLRAFAMVVSKHPSTVLVLVGDGPFRGRLEALAKELHLEDQVRFLGGRADVGEILDDLDAFVMSSREEGLPVALLEAMAAALPVVATEVGGIPDVVASGKTGMLVPPGDPNGLAEAINAVVENRDRAITMGLEAQRVVRERFDLSRMVSRYEDVYVRLWQSKRRGRIRDALCKGQSATV